MTRLLLLLTVIGGLAFGGAAHGFAQSARELLDALPAKIRASAEAKPPQGVQRPDVNYLLGFARQAREYLEDGQETGTTQQLRALAGTNTTDAVRDACEAIVNKLHAENVDRETAATAATAAVLQHARAAILGGKVPPDLDGALQELSRAAETPRDPAHPNDALTRRLQNAARFVSRWQDYLLSLSRNDPRQAGETLRSLVSESNDAIQALGLPRSELITRIPPPPREAETVALKHSAADVATALNAVLNRTKTLDDLPGAIKDVQAIRDEQPGGYNGSDSNDLNATLSALQMLSKARLEFQAGLRTNLTLMSDRYNNDSRIPGGFESCLVPLRAQLVALELPRLLGAPATEKPALGETLDLFWRRLLDAAKKRGDWNTVAEGLGVGRSLVFTGDSRNPENYNRDLDASGFKSMLAAFNYEAAGQYAQAVVSYLSALGSTVPDLPVALIGERLAAIKKAHPAEYALGDHANLPPGTEDYAALRRTYRLEPPAPSAGATPVPSPTPTPAPSPTPVATPTGSPATVP